MIYQVVLTPSSVPTIRYAVTGTASDGNVTQNGERGNLESVLQLRFVCECRSLHTASLLIRVPNPHEATEKYGISLARALQRGSFILYSLVVEIMTL